MSKDINTFISHCKKKFYEKFHLFTSLRSGKRKLIKFAQKMHFYVNFLWENEKLF